MHVLVTGGAGFIGSAIVKGLLHRGHQVRVLDDISRGILGRLANVEKDIEFIDGDVRDADAVDKATKGIDAVAHLAFVNGTESFYSKPKLVLDVGVKGAINTLDSAIKHDVSQYWLMSSSEVYQTPPQVPTDESVGFYIPDPLNPRYSYAGGKVISELLAINYGREAFSKTIIVRPHNVYGPDMGHEHVMPQFILRAKELVDEHPAGVIPFPIQGDGTQSRSFVYIDDFVDGCLLAFLNGENGIYHVGTMDERNIADIAQMVVECFGRQAKIIPGELPKGGTNRRCPDINKVQALGFNPQTTLEAGVKHTIEWYRGHANS
jgi:nucleoside-diphosphate-sugar epimerase